MYMRKKNIVLGTTITSTLYEKYMHVAHNNVYGFEPFDFNLSYYCTQEFANWWRQYFYSRHLGDQALISSLESGFTQPQINRIEQQVKPTVTKKQVPEAVERIEEPSKARKRSTTTTTTETGPSKKPKPSVVVESEEEEERKRSQPPVRIETNIPEDIPSDNPSAKERQKKKQEKKEKKEKKEKRKEEKRGSEGQPKEKKKKKKSKSSSDPSEANLGVPSVSNEQKEPTPQAETQEDTILSDATPDPPSNVPQQDTVQEEIISNKASGDTPKDSEATISEKIMPEPNQDQPEHPDSNEPQDKTFPFQEWGKTAPVEVELSASLGLPEEEFIALQRDDPEAALKLLLSKKTPNPLSSSGPSNSTASDSEINSSVRQDSLISKLYNEFINGDILASVEEHPSNAFKHKSFLNRLHNPHTDVETLGKVIKLESILDQFAIIVHNLRRNSQKLVGQQAAYDALFEKAMAAQSKVEQMKAQVQQPGLGIQECNNNIAKWEAEIQSFRAEIADREQKILEEKTKRLKIEEAIAATTQESIRKAAKDGISHFSAAAVIKEEIKSLEDAIKIQSVEVGLIKDHYADFKSKCLP
ncbi:hypothetical protein L195_g017513 [Trifolium pratense]|uniref:Uncharacterized protein n=1 Tax=Trifolium pratense TaxID=57577 RepID=A0A2K3MU49_TRIPR|nr:hypothetical protein L195_g017513 [Trifolium pratense]